MRRPGVVLVVLGSEVPSWGHTCRIVHLWYGVELQGVSGEAVKKDSFRDTPAGPPSSWVPPGSSSPQCIPWSSSKTSPHPSEEGRGTCCAGVRGPKDGVGAS